MTKKLSIATVPSFGKTLKKLRKEANMTQSGLAEKLFVSDKTISKWENGSSEPSLEIVQKIADIFGVSANFLLENNKNANEQTLSVYETACKYDDPKLLEGLDLKLPDKYGKKIQEYVDKYDAWTVKRLLSKQGIYDDKFVPRHYDNYCVLKTNYNGKTQVQTCSLRLTNCEEVREKLLKQPFRYKEVKIMKMLGSNDSVYRDYDRFCCQVENTIGISAIEFYVVMLEDHKSAILLLKYKIKGEQQYHIYYVNPESYQRFLLGLDTFDLASYKGEKYGMAVNSFYYSVKDNKNGGFVNRSHIKPPVEEYKKFLQVLVRLVMDSVDDRQTVKEFMSLFNFDLDPVYVCLIPRVHSKEMIQSWESIDHDCTNVGGTLFYDGFWWQQKKTDTK